MSSYKIICNVFKTGHPQKETKMDDNDISLASDKVDLFLDLWEAESCGTWRTEPTRTGERVALH